MTPYDLLDTMKAMSAILSNENLPEIARTNAGENLNIALELYKTFLTECQKQYTQANSGIKIVQTM